MVYHVTFLKNLHDIAENGIVPGVGQTGGAKFLYHSKGRIFFSDKKGVSHWFNIISEVSDSLSDNAYESGHVPVVLRFPMPDAPKIDTLGKDESYADAWYYEDPVYDDIEVWDGSDWIDVDEWESIDTSKSFDFEDDDGETIAWLKFYTENPLFPPSELSSTTRKTTPGES